MASKIAFVLLLLWNLISIEAHLVGKLCGNLPYGRQDTTAVYDGQDGIYFIGGNSRYNDEVPQHYIDDIVRVSVETHDDAVVGHLPVPLSGGGAAIDGNGNIFYFGGHGKHPIPSQAAIYKFSPGESTPVHINNLNRNMSGLSAVSVGGAEIYVFGGSSNEILLYNSDDNTLEVVAHLSTPISSPSLTYDGQNIYLFGGYSGGEEQGITKFSPSTHTVQVVDTILSHSISTASFGGNHDSILFGAGEFSRFHHDTEIVDRLTVDIDIGFMNGPVSIYVPKNNNFYLNGGGGMPPYSPKVHCIDLTYG